MRPNEILVCIIQSETNPVIYTTTKADFIKDAKFKYKQTGLEDNPDYGRDIFDSEIEWAIAVMEKDTLDCNIFNWIDDAIYYYQRHSHELKTDNILYILKDLWDEENWRRYHKYDSSMDKKNTNKAFTENVLR